MQPYGVNVLRKMFLDFFAGKEHLVMKSFPLVPQNDNSLLLINSGMAPLKPYFTGREIPPSKRVATCQKCIRTGDIENVGKTARHGTFFEMLGNFSFGDYFKREAIAWSWEFLTETVGIDPERLYPSVYVDDDEAFSIWHNEMGIAKERIFRFGKEDNFWEHGSGPCGPCSEIYYDRGEKYGCDRPDCTVGCECDRYIEVWNNVFTQFDNDGAGNYSELEQKNIDTGMGLERLALVVQDAASIFDVDTIKALRDHVCQMAGVSYEEDEQKDVSIRVITDHIRSVTFMCSDGITPSNEGRGYVMRRLLRRACRHGRLLGIEGSFLPTLAETVISGSKDGYPELEEKKAVIIKVIAQEEQKFNQTIEQGLKILSDMIEQLEKEGSSILSGDDAFRLHDTYGFPLDLTREILEEKQIRVDDEGFRQAMEVQRRTARGARAVTNYNGAEETVYDRLSPDLTSRFVGYDDLCAESYVTALTTEVDTISELSCGENGTVFVEDTPFYATSGGQEADTGVIRTQSGVFEVRDTIKLLGGKIGHVGTVKEGVIKVGDTASLCVDEQRRMLSARNHSATHLLQKALKLVLGDHVEQAGSRVDDERLRFDFTHFSPMTDEEIARVEQIVNGAIQRALPVSAKNMPIEEAKKTGASALFGEKYGDIVRVVDMDGFSIEFCGGTHVSNTSEIAGFKIVSESGVAAGVRRIEALTSDGMLAYYRQLEEFARDAAAVLKTTPDQLPDKVSSLVAEQKELRRELESLKAQAAQSAASDVLDRAVEVCGVRLLCARFDNIEPQELRTMGDTLKEKLGDGVVVLASVNGGQVLLMATATESAVQKKAHAGMLIKALAPMVGGGGGGRPNMAQAGGKNPAGVDDALAAAKQLLSEQLSH